MHASLPLILGLPALTLAAHQNTTSPCPPIGVTTISPYDLATLVRPTTSISDLLTTQTIREVLALYVLAVDGRNWDGLDAVFVPDVQASYPAPTGNFTSLQAIKTGLAAGLDPFASTEHVYGTQIVNVCSADAAVSVTYVVANQFFDLGRVVPPEEIVNSTDALYAYAQYQDLWARQSDGSWKITNRIMVYMVSIFTVSSTTALNQFVNTRLIRGSRHR